MRILKFLKLLQNKINKYDRISTNPFGKMPISITLIWVEESENIKNQN